MEEAKLLRTLNITALLLLINITSIAAQEEISQQMMQDIKNIEQSSNKNVQDFLTLPENKEIIKSITSNQPDVFKTYKEHVDHKILIHNHSSGDSYNLKVFISMSMPEKGLIDLAKQVKSHNGTLLMRGFVQGSHIKTISLLQKMLEEVGIGVLIDPESFKKYHITEVPTFVLTRADERCLPNSTCIPALYDKIVGNISVNYVLDKFAKEGDLKDLFLKARGL